MTARLTRAKKTIVAAGIPFAIPDRDALPGRLATVAQTAYLAFTAGYAPASGPDLLRPALAGEAVRLVRTVRDLRPEAPTLTALLALVLLQHSRRDAPVDAEGRLVLLGEQDRGGWHRDEIDEALGLPPRPRSWTPSCPTGRRPTCSGRSSAPSTRPPPRPRRPGGTA